jgi:glycosyltransferase involved in cell wall biosynthesis
VAFLGFVQNPFQYMARAHVFVLSSIREGSPNVLVQALACGCAVVATDCPSGPREILDGGRIGPIVPIDDPEALARAIESQLDRPTARSALVEAASHFSLERAVTAYLDVLLDRPRHGGGASTG